MSVYRIYNGEVLSDIAVGYYDSLLVSSGGTALRTTVNSNGRIYYGMSVLQGGTAKSTTINSGGSMDVYKGTAFRTTVNLGGRMSVSTGALANSVTIDGSGALYVNYEGLASNVVTRSGGYLCVSSGGTVTKAVLSDYSTYSFNRVLNGGLLSKIEVRSRAYLCMSSGASVTDLQVSSAGRAYASGAVLGKTEVKRGGVLFTVGGGETTLSDVLTLAGELRTTDGVFSGTLNGGRKQIKLDLTGRKTNELAFVDNLSRLSSFSLSVSVSKTQQSGLYNLAAGAASFTGTIKVSNTSGSSISLKVGGSSSLGTQKYQLNVTKSMLTLSVTNTGTQTPAKIKAYTPGTWSTDWEQASEYAREHNLPILGYFGDPVRCGFCDAMNTDLFESEDFKKLTKDNAVLLFETPVPGKSYSGSPSLYILDADGNARGSRYGFGNGAYDSLMRWLSLELDQAEPGVYVQSGTGAIVSRGVRLSGLDIPSSHSGYVVSTTLTGGTVSGTDYYSTGYLILKNRGTASNTEVGSNGRLDVCSGGKAAGAAVYVGGRQNIFGGGKALDTTLSGGQMHVSGGTAFRTAVSSGGVYVSSGGTVVSTTVSSSGWMSVSSGGKAISAAVSSGGRMSVVGGGTVTSTTLSGGRMYVSSGGKATRVMVDSGGWMYLSSGGTVTSATVSTKGNLYVSSGGTVVSATVSSGGGLYVSGGGKTTKIVENGGYVKLADGANATFVAHCFSGLVLSSGLATVHSGTTAAGTIIRSGGCLYVSKGGLALRTTIRSGGWMSVSSGGTAASTTVSSGGGLYVSSGGTVAGATIRSDGWMSVSSGGKAISAAVSSGGCMYISSGGKITGSLKMVGGAVVRAYEGSEINFDLTARRTTDAALVNDLSLVRGTPDFSLTVSADQTAGTYKLAKGAANFSGSIRVINGATGQKYGVLSVGGSLTKGGNTYVLSVKSDLLSVSLIDKVPPAKPKIVSVSTMAMTNKSVTVKATFSSDSAKKQYSLDNKTWKNYSTTGVVLKANGTVYFRGIDAAGNISGVVSKKITNICPKGDFTNDTLAAAKAKTALNISSAKKITGWVGLGDPKDFIKLQVQKAGRVSLDMNAATAKAQKAGAVKLSLLNSAGKTVAVSARDSDTLATKSKVAAGVYYLGVACANVNKYSTSYTITAGMLAG